MRHLQKGVLEPDIEEIINDPIVEMLMQRDGVKKDPLRALLREAGMLAGYPGGEAEAVSA